MLKMNLAEKDLARFWSHVAKRGDDECWEWQASKVSNGYGQFQLNGKPVKAHRVAYVSSFGEIPVGLFLHHTCCKKSCCNPSHLQLVTQFQHEKITTALGQRPKGLNHIPAHGLKNGAYTHPECMLRGEQVTTSKLTKEKVVEIRHLRKQGIAQRVIAKLFGIGKTQVSRIEKREAWRDV
jgi:hypothetical protein